MYKHRQSVDSAASGESQSRFSPTNHSVHSLTHDVEHMQHMQHMSLNQQPASNRQSPELCVSGDDDEQEHKSLISQHSISPVSSLAQTHHHQVHSPLAVRASPVQHTSAETTFAIKMQSLSPVSVCSITHETSAPSSNYEEPMNQDCPMDLSMKTSRSSVHSDSDMLSETSSSEEERQQNMRRKFYQMESSNENSENSSDSEANKRQKLAEANYAAFGSHHAQRGIVCV
ncbi:zygotic gap protein knirps [Lucilia sericata]|uniref:zygotic gap protein knirps n=1 Tax=Lucilia sericata TaxID=13632 RepID=UPI0018A7EC29|nr:zygotic gap protein knirps [Lucilia sericata]